MRQHIDEQKIDKQGDRYRVEELRFLNKQLSEQITQLRDQNDLLMQRVRHCSQVVQKKYEELEQKTMKRMQQSLKRVKKAIHYLQTLSIKDIEKTKEYFFFYKRILIENLKKSVELLKGKYVEQNNAEYEIQELMDPLRKLQEQITIKNKEVNGLRLQNKKLQQQVKKHKKIECQLLPQYKLSIEGLKKNLAQVRGQLSQNEIQKVQIKKKYEQKLRSVQQKHQQLLVSYRKNKLQKKIFQNKLQQLEQEKQQEKQRLVGENEMLKKLYEMKKKTNAFERHQQQLQINHGDQSLQQQDQQSEFVQQNSQDGYEGRFDEIHSNRPTDAKRYNTKVTQNYKLLNDQFKKNKSPNSRNNDYQNQQTLGCYNSADYYNNHKTTKNTYGDEVIESRKVVYEKNPSYKEVRNNRKQVSVGNSRIAMQDNNRTNLRKKYSRQRLSISRSRNNPQRQKRNYEQSANSRLPFRKQLNRSSLTNNQQQQNGSQQQPYEEQYEFADENDTSSYQPDQQTSMMSQESLKNQICRIDQEIMEIQKNLTKQLQAYK